MRKQAFAREFPRNFRDIFASFSKFSLVFSSLLRFSDLLGPAWTCSDASGCIRMRLDAFGCIRRISDAFGKFRKKLPEKSVFCTFGEVFEDLRRNGRHQQVPREFPLRIHLFGDRYDPWSSSWHRVPSWDGLREPDWPAPRCILALILSQGGGEVTPASY